MIQGGVLEERYCALVDILGFSNYVRNLAGVIDKSERDKVVARLQRINAQFEEERTKFRTDFRDNGSLTYFSDTVFLSIRADVEKSFRRLCHYVERICTALLIEGFLTRGAIVCGDIYHENSVVFGPAIVDAHRIESAIAKFPRIVIAGSARSRTNEIDGPKNQLLPCDDGPVRLNCLNFFERFAERVTGPDSIEFIASDRFLKRIDFLKAVVEHLELQIHSTRDEPESHAKVRWFAEEFNTRVLSKVPTGVAGWPKPISFAIVWPQAI